MVVTRWRLIAHIYLGGSERKSRPRINSHPLAFVFAMQFVNRQVRLTVS